MAYNEDLAERVRKSFGKRKGLAERKMFGGLCFTVNGHMAAGVVDDKLMLRVGPEQYEGVLKLKHAQPMDFTGKPMKGMVYVACEGCKTATQIKPWLKRALSFVESLPPK
ncbi:MAG: TfoX/Sxy family protein [Planctomycetes bacterium]|nr:TfoX/Sxy family protein [Planctomycetota bacterium]